MTEAPVVPVTKSGTPGCPGCFVADRKDHGVGGKVVFNRVTGLKDSWGK